MKKMNLVQQGARLLLPACCLAVLSTTANDSIPNTRKKNLDYVDPTIGNVGALLEPTRPTVQLPNQVIRFTPDRKDRLDDQISCFPLTVVSHRLGEVFAVKPALGELTASNWTARLAYDHDLEVNRPYYYSTYLLDKDITVEFAPGKKAGYYRFTFPQGVAKSLLFSVYNDGASSYQFGPGNVLTGMETWNDDVKIYCYGVFSEAGKTNVDGHNASITFPDAVKTVEFKYAISFVSAAQAKKNFEAEVPKNTFAAARANGEKAWANVMDQIQVEGGTEAQRRAFFTALYRTNERMVNIMEDGQYYSGYDKQVHTDTRPFYVDDWSWDTYLAAHPLRMILKPSQEEDMLQSYVRMYQQSGWMPTFPVLFGDHACMNGFHSSIVLLDAYRKGLHNFDINTAYEGMRKNSTDATLLPWRNGPKTVLDDFYHEHGYFPALAPGEKETVAAVDPFEKRQAVAVTLGASYDDWAVSQLAGDLGKKDDQQKFAKASQNYKNLWEADKQFFMPKDEKGKFLDIDPTFDGGMGGRDYYDENNGWTYMWQVQHDIPGLIDLMGGKDKFEARLDRLFREGLGRAKYAFNAKFPDATGLTGQHSMGNEPSFHIPYLYNYTAPWKTQQRVRFLLDTWFKDNIFGIPGDEDGGGMSAFVVFSSMGFYPITPGIPAYTVGSPVFSKVSIALENGKHFTVLAHGASVVNKYIQRATLNGKPLNKPFFTHADLVSGGTLELFMGPKPNKQWGVN
ncbi:GH92 family glycosyl hydrolase [Chitinophaga parva]|nr:GH92 family glycosyl hydrolase [Chitinophaga parva]